MEFIIGNGYVFAEKDVFEAIQNLDVEAKAEIAKNIVGDLARMVIQGKSKEATREDKLNKKDAEDALERIFSAGEKALV